MSPFLLALLLIAQGDTAAINRYVQAEMRRQRIPGVSLAVLQGDQVLLARGYGFANVELQVPAADSTVYQSGSMGKQFTAALVEMLVAIDCSRSTTRSCAGSRRAAASGRGSPCGICSRTPPASRNTPTRRS